MVGKGNNVTYVKKLLAESYLTPSASSHPEVAQSRDRKWMSQILSLVGWSIVLPELVLYIKKVKWVDLETGMEPNLELREVKELSGNMDGLSILEMVKNQKSCQIFFVSLPSYNLCTNSSVRR